MTAARAWLEQQAGPSVADAPDRATAPELDRTWEPARGPEPGGGDEAGPSTAAEPASADRPGLGAGRSAPAGSAAAARRSAPAGPPPALGGSRRSHRGAAAARDPGRGADGEPDADPESVARTIVLRKLAAQARTRHELATALSARQVPEEVAAEVLDRMESVGLVDDASFARDWVQSRQQRRHLSKSALRRELQAKGVERETVDEAVAEVAGDDELEAAEALAVKKLRTMNGLARDVQYRRLAGALGRRGFGPGITSTVIGRVLDQPRP